MYKYTVWKNCRPMLEDVSEDVLILDLSVMLHSLFDETIIIFIEPLIIIYKFDSTQTEVIFYGFSLDIFFYSFKFK